MILKSEISYKNLFNQTRDGIYITSVDGRILEANKAMCTITACTVEDLGKVNVSSLYANIKERKDFQKLIEKTGYVNDFPFKLKNKKGVIKDCIVSASSLISENGNVIGYQGIIKDFSLRKEAELKILEERKKRLIDITYVQEREKKRISKDLHDGIGQMLFGIKMKLDRLKKTSKDHATINAEINKIYDEVGKTIEEVRNMSYNLHPSVLDDFGIISAIKLLCEQIGNSSQISIKFTTINTQLRFSPKVETSIYRIVQESINNAIKHANATQITVTISRKTKDVLIAITDNGVGFEVTSPTEATVRGNGLLNLNSRAEIINGQLNIDSKKGKGTTISLLVAVKKRLP